MAVSLVSTGVQFPDSTIQTTAAGALPSFTASGSISAGAVVGINSNGTVSVITGAASALGGSYNSNYPTISQTGYQATAAMNDTGATILVFQQTLASGTPGTLIAGTVSGTEITFGTEVSLGNSVYSASIMYCPAQGVFVVSYMTGGGTNTIRCVSVSGTTITLGTAVSGYGAPGAFVGLASDCSGSVVFGCTKAAPAGTNYACMVSFTVSGTTISSTAVFALTSGGDNINGEGGRCAYAASSGLVCATYRNSSNGSIFYSFATYSGSTFTLGTSNNVSIGSGPNYCTVTYSATKDCFILNYSAILRVLTYAATTGTLGTALSTGLAAADYYAPSAQYNNCGDRLGASFVNGSNQLVFITYTVDTTARTLTQDETFTVFSSGGSQMGAVCCSVSSSKSQLVANTFVQFRDANTNGFRAVTVGFSTRANAIGIAQSTVSNGASVSVKTLGGTDSNQSGLTTGSDYYIGTTGTVSTTVSSGFKIGKALSATQLLITQNA